jgi:cytochrome c553
MSKPRRRGPRPRGGGRRFLLPAVPALFVIAFASAALAGDPAAGKEAAAACTACHGLDGMSRRADAPHIAGQIELYLVEQLKKYRSGARAHPVMNIIAESLSDREIADLAAHYAAIKVSVEPSE